MSSEQAAKFALVINLKTAAALGRHLNELRTLCARPRNPSLWLDASRSNDFAPLRALLGDEGSKLGRRIPLRHDAKGLETLGGFRPFEIRSQRGVERVDDRPRRASAGEKALPAAGVVAGHRFGKSRHAG